MMDAKNLPPLPEGWVWEKLGEVAQIIGGGTPSRENSEYFSGDILWLTPTEVPKGRVSVIFETREKITLLGLQKSSAKKIPEGAVLLTSRATIGNVAIAGREITTNQGFASLIACPKVNNYFLAYWLLANTEMLVNNAKGTTFKEISKGVLKEFYIPVPPLDVQIQIVAKIEELFSQLDAGVSALKRAQVNLKRYKASVLKAACEGRLVPTEAELARAEGRDYEPAEVLLKRILAERRSKWEEQQRAKGRDTAKLKYEEPRSPDTTGLPELPEGWCWATIGQVGNHRLGKMLDKEKNKGKLRPYLRNINVRWFSFDLSDIQLMRIKDEELEEVSVRKGDLIICEGGEPGRAAVWNYESVTYAIQKALHRVRFYSEVSPGFVAYLLAYSANSGYLEKHFTGSTIKHFTGEALKSFVIPLPPLKEQYWIVTEIERNMSILDSLENNCSSIYKKSAMIRNTILMHQISLQRSVPSLVETDEQERN